MLGVTANCNLTFFSYSVYPEDKTFDDMKHREVFLLHLPAIHYVLPTWLLIEHVNYHFTLPRRIQDKKKRFKLDSDQLSYVNRARNGSQRKTLLRCLRRVIIWVKGWQLLGHMVIGSWICWISRPKLRWSLRIRLSLDFPTRSIWRQYHCYRLVLWLRN